MRVSITNASSVTQQAFRVQERECSSSDPRIAFFNQHAPTWDRDANDVAHTLRRLEALRDRLALQPGQDLLELGCGTGRITPWLVEKVRPGRVVAADFSPEMLAQAQARNAATDFWQLDICAPPPASDLFDVVFCFNAFPHFRDQSEALRNIFSLLKSGGRLVILHLAGSARLNHFHGQLAPPVCHDHLPPAKAWPGLMQETGLQLQSCTDEPELFLVDAIAPKFNI
jgi:demethylmenaquinone methyltransferase/2-methoxy-6-polyprenyl-1,4-benzoquinol methylase